MKHYIYKGARASEGARNLQEELDAVMLRSEGSAYRGRPNSCVINWGCTNQEARRLEGIAPLFLNKVDAVRRVANKAEFFPHMKEHLPQYTIPFCTTYDEAKALVAAGGRLFARTVTNGHSGEGIRLMIHRRDQEIQSIARVIRAGNIPVDQYDPDIGGFTGARELLGARLFTQGISGKRTEFRIHVVKGQVILAQVKLRKADYDQNPNANTLVRNLAGGWIYAIQGVEEVAGYNDAKVAAVAAVEACGLDFGAVDIIYQEQGTRTYVLEINTAPGLADEGSAVTAYSNAFKEYE